MNYIITGSRGRMGQSLVRILTEANASIIEVNKETKLSTLTPPSKSVVVDFSSLDFFSDILSWCVENKVPFVSGTTGLSESQFSDLDQASNKIPVLWAPNMSIGVAFINKLLKHYGQLSEQFDFQVEEFHHKHKRDKPSGTAIFLQDTLEKAVQKNIPEVLAVRGGGIFGNHKVWAMSEDETILLEHNALNRDVFSRGALRCAQWIQGKPVGKYSIDMVIDA